MPSTRSQLGQQETCARQMSLPADLHRLDRRPHASPVFASSGSGSSSKSFTALAPE